MNISLVFHYPVVVARTRSGRGNPA